MMKNERTLFVGTDKTGKETIRSGKSPGVRVFINQTQSQFADQFRKSQFDFIPSPTPIALIAELILYVGASSKTGLPSGDNDNAYTTLQETLQGVIIDDDHQVRHTDSIWTPAKSKMYEMSLLYVYVLNDTHPYKQFRRFIDWHEATPLLSRLNNRPTGVPKPNVPQTNPRL